MQNLDFVSSGITPAPAAAPSLGANLMSGGPPVSASIPLAGDGTDAGLAMPSHADGETGGPASSEAALREANQLLEQRVAERTREIERRRQAADGVHDVLAILNSNRSLDEVLVYILTRASHLLDATAAVVHQFDLERRLVTIEAEVGLPPHMLLTRTFPMQEGWANDTIRARQPLIISSAGADHARFYRDMAAARVPPAILEAMQGLQGSFLAVPLVVREDVYGSLAFHNPAGRAFSSDDVALALAFADQAALAIENAQLRTRAAQAAVAAERSRLARDLHDAVTQTLFSASLIADVLPRLWERDPAEGRRRLAELRQLTRGALAEMRTLLIELRPGALTAAPLPELLKLLADAVAGRAHVPVSISLVSEHSLPSDMRVSLYRIAQEALNNVARHARASRAILEFRCTACGYALLIEDDGCGFNPATVTADHLGLNIMRERAEAIGALLTIDSSPGLGTRIHVVGREPAEDEP